MKPYESDATFTDQSYLHQQTARAIGPAVQSIITGAFIGLLVLVLVIYWDVADVWFWATFAGLSSATLTWLYLLGHWWSLTAAVERAVNIDIDEDGTIGEPVTIEPPKLVRVEVHNDNKGFAQTTFAELPYAERIPELAAGLAANIPFTVARWVGQSKGRLFTANEFITLRDALLAHGWIRANNEHDESRGYSLTRTGLDVMRGLAQSPTELVGNGWVKR